MTSEADTTDDQKQVKVLSAKALRSTSQAATDNLSAAIRTLKPGKHIDLTLTLHQPPSTPLIATIS